MTLFTTSAVALAQTGGSATSLLNLEANIFWLLISAFGIGVVLTFTPCVLPMIPIVSAIIVSQEDAPKSSIRGGIFIDRLCIGYRRHLCDDRCCGRSDRRSTSSLFSKTLVIGSFSSYSHGQVHYPCLVFTNYAYLHSSRQRFKTSANRIRTRSVGAVFFLGLVFCLNCRCLCYSLTNFRFGCGNCRRRSTVGGRRRCLQWH